MPTASLCLSVPGPRKLLRSRTWSNCASLTLREAYPSVDIDKTDARDRGGQWRVAKAKGKGSTVMDFTGRGVLVPTWLRLTRQVYMELIVSFVDWGSEICALGLPTIHAPEPYTITNGPSVAFRQICHSTNRGSETLPP